VAYPWDDRFSSGKYLGGDGFRQLSLYLLDCGWSERPLGGVLSAAELVCPQIQHAGDVLKSQRNSTVFAELAKNA
jgi:hypothetical protein